MKKALVLGASGGMGYAIVKELSSRGIETIAFSRSNDKLIELFGDDSHVIIHPGDVFVEKDIIAAAKGVEVIFHAVNIPYPEWEEKQSILINNVLKAGKENEAKIAMVDNIYAYGRSNGTKVKEDTPKQPHTKKGKIRLQNEKLVSASDVPVLIAHFPDFYGPNAENTLVHYTISSMEAKKRAMFVGDQTIPREYIFTPDGAKAIVELSLNEKAYGQNWNIPGCGVITGNEMIEIARRLTGNQKRVLTATKTLIKFLGLFDKQMREFVEMLYLTEEPVVLSGEKYEKEIGPLSLTSYENGMKKTIDHIRLQKKETTK